VRPLYLAYPGEQEAYAAAGAEYLYGPDMLVAPVTTPGASATTTVWFPPGSTWTDYFTGRTYQGGTTEQITTTLDTMPVFVRSGGIVVTHTGDVSNAAQHPLTAATATVTAGANGRTILREEGTSATTELTYRQSRKSATLHIGASRQPAQRAWTVLVNNTDAPRSVRVDGHARTAWTYSSTTRTLTITVPKRSARTPVTVTIA
jgi:alpha-glucosidase (family GH31 glycosyl hydrolase)